MGNLAERDYLSYQRLFDLVINSLPRPDLLIYLKAPVSVLMNRIHWRARNMETGITADYLPCSILFTTNGLPLSIFVRC